ncbi:uncharacterized protein LAESUDRAFT_765481 [Laetiporus sulphureus 93-53]|uniref:Uncharacterized protein n=1 Tax=Laetiporus sulphureus 93-53 TaxID=1314785 RepID=A0A165AQW2_9APHY|nr:uncharacterized protein LAESUDRAFT_765481 [Laetiporus sulphureus 93-53]KZS99480.1 hypothetical protein LAESUDRAFT_765481 [Laetiporus sulphureus 93-53]
MPSHILKLQKIRENLAEAHHGVADLTDEDSDVEDKVAAHRTAVQKALVLLTEEARHRRLYPSPSLIPPCIDKAPSVVHVADQPPSHCLGVVEPILKDPTLVAASCTPPVAATSDDEGSDDIPLRRSTLIMHHNRNRILSPPYIASPNAANIDVDDAEPHMSAPVALSVEDLVDENEGDENVDEEVVDEVVDEDTNSLQITAIERSGEISEDDEIDSEILATLFGDEEEGEQVELIGDNEDHSDREESMVEEVAADDQQDKIGRLIVEFLNYPQIHPLLPVEFRDMVMDRPSGIRSKQDKDGFQRICAGVLWANKSEWVSLICDSFNVV